VALSIRARLTLWYTLVTLGVLVLNAALLSAVHSRMGLGRVDQELAGNLTTVATGIRYELDHGLNVPEAVEDTLAELELPGAGIAVLDANRTVVGSRASGVPTPPSSILGDSTSRPVSFRTANVDVRLRAFEETYREQFYRVVVWTSLAPFAAERRTVMRTLWLAFPFAVLLAAAGGWILGWRALEPLSQMAHQANTIDEHRLDARLVVRDGGDELAALGSAFNSVLDRLAGALQAQRRFMADASHQLRTPLSVTRTAAQVTLAQQERTPAEYRESLTIVAEQTQRLTRIVDDMFTLALADLDARPLHVEELYIDEVVHDCVRAARVLASQREVAIDVRTPEDVQLRGDEGLVRQMVLNLVENAVHHTPPGGRVDVTAATAGTDVRVEVADSGAGIPEQDRERIFERFVRLDAAVGSNGGGGLGLPIARWIAQLHGGTLTLDSTGPRGSRFVVVLPKRSGNDRGH
jgi:heavy metal sensor kinase